VARSGEHQTPWLLAIGVLAISVGCSRGPADAVTRAASNSQVAKLSVKTAMNTMGRLLFKKSQGRPIFQKYAFG